MKRKSFKRFIVFCIWVLLSCAALGWSSSGYAGGLVQIADNVYSYIDVKGSSPSNSFGANAGIIIGRDGIAVIDTLTSAKEGARFIKDIRAVSSKPVLYVINTHWHLDHTFGNSEFEKLGALIISHANCKKNMEKNGEAVLRDAGKYGFTEQDMAGTKLAYPFLIFNERIEINLGDQEIQLIYPGPSHTDGSIMVFLPDKKLLFAGDMLFTNYHPFIANGDIGSWTKALDYIMTLDAVTIVPGHGPLSSKKDVGDMKDYLILFDKKAKELAAGSDDVEHITAEIMKVLPPLAEGQGMVSANIAMKYIKK
jgi:cyclase